MKNKDRFEDDNRVIADMSGIEPQPMLIPGLGRPGADDKKNGASARQSNQHDSSVQLSGGEKRALIRGALAAGLLVLLALASAFAALILIIGRLG